MGQKALSKICSSQAGKCDTQQNVEWFRSNITKAGNERLPSAQRVQVLSSPEAENTLRGRAVMTTLQVALFISNVLSSV